MSVFKLSNSKLTQLKETKIDLEKNIQSIAEANLDTIFGLQLISTEFALQNFRIDTLAYDQETNSFVIIEYKRDRSFSLVDQGVSYLGLMLYNKDSFILEYARKTNTNLNEIKINWQERRIIFIANSFTPHQLNAVNFKDFPIELWEVKRFQDNLITFNQIKSAQEPTENLKSVSKDKNIDKVTASVKKSTIDDHFQLGWTESREIYEELRERILKIDSRIEERPQISYIGYYIAKSMVIDIKVHKSKILLELLRVEPMDLKDPEKKVRYKVNSYKFLNKHVSQFDINSLNDVDYAIFLVKQVYEKFVK